MKKYFIIVILLISGIYSNAQQQVVPFTLDDRERLIRIEAAFDGLRNEMNSLPNEMNSLRNEMSRLRNEMNPNFDSIDARFDEILKKFDYVIWMLWMIIALQIITIGYLIGNRLTTVAKIKSEMEELKRENEKMKAIFIKQAESQPKLLEILKNAGIL